MALQKFSVAASTSLVAFVRHLSSASLVRAKLVGAVHRGRLPAAPTNADHPGCLRRLWMCRL